MPVDQLHQTNSSALSIGHFLLRAKADHKERDEQLNRYDCNLAKEQEVLIQIYDILLAVSFAVVHHPLGHYKLDYCKELID
jgi:hypothetical protein